MSALSIQLPDTLAKASKHAAHKLGISRAEFIRQAIEHELESLEARREIESIAKSFKALKKNASYLKEIQELDEGFNTTTLPKDKKQWWKKKES
jgi:metal-responsive CopG/Arc/MetJ family transcriptional regulator